MVSGILMVCDCDSSSIRVGEMRAGPGVLGYWTTIIQNSFPESSGDTEFDVYKQVFDCGL